LPIRAPSGKAPIGPMIADIGQRCPPRSPDSGCPLGRARRTGHRLLPTRQSTRDRAV